MLDPNSSSPNPPHVRASAVRWLLFSISVAASVAFASLLATLKSHSPLAGGAQVFFWVLGAGLYASSLLAAHRCAAPIHRPIGLALIYALTFPVWAALLLFAFTIIGFMLGQADGVPDDPAFASTIERQRIVAIMLDTTFAAVVAIVNGIALWWFTFRRWTGVGAALITVAAIVAMEWAGPWPIPAWHAAMGLLLGVWSASTWRPSRAR